MGLGMTNVVFEIPNPFYFFNISLFLVPSSKKYQVPT